MKQTNKLENMSSLDDDELENIIGGANIGALTSDMSSSQPNLYLNIACNNPDCDHYSIYTTYHVVDGMYYCDHCNHPL